MNEWSAHTHMHAQHYITTNGLLFILESEEKENKTPKCRYKIRNIIMILLLKWFCVLMFMFLISDRGLLCERTHSPFISSFANIVRFVLLLLPATSYDLVSIIKLTNSDAFINNNNNNNKTVPITFISIRS